MNDNLSLKKSVSESWKRCESYGLKKTDGIYQLLPEEEVNKSLIKNKQLIRIADKYMQTIFHMIIGVKYMIILTDRNGMALKYKASEASFKDINIVNYGVGVSHSEKYIGNNGLGTAIALDEPVEVFGKEHYCQIYHFAASIGVPIHNENNEVIGCLGCAVDKKDLHPHTRGMLLAMVKNIENTIILEATLKERDMQAKLLKNTINSVLEGIVTFDFVGRITEINNVAMDLLGIKDIDDINIKKIFPKDIFQLLSIDKEIVENVEVTLKTKKGNIKCFVAGTPITDEDGNLSGVVATINKISNIHKLTNKISGSYAHYSFDDIIGCDIKFLQSLEVAKMAGSSTSNILIYGESGVGKELVAQAIHNESYSREKPFIAINCSAIPKDLLESELFGYEEGTFTGAVKGGKPGKFELADGGTIFLDEIGDMPINMQGSLLRVLQERCVTRLGSTKNVSVDVRVISATNKDLKKQIEDGLFRSDLFYRLNVITVELPPLRERVDDIHVFVQSFIAKLNKKLNKNVTCMDDLCLKKLFSYSWPGNVRELENVIEYCMNICKDKEVIDLSCLPKSFLNAGNGYINNHELLLLEAVEKRHIEKVLSMTNGNKKMAAKILGIDRGTLYNKMRV